LLVPHRWAPKKRIHDARWHDHWHGAHADCAECGADVCFRCCPRNEKEEASYLLTHQVKQRRQKKKNGALPPGVALRELGARFQMEDYRRRKRARDRQLRGAQMASRLRLNFSNDRHVVEIAPGEVGSSSSDGGARGDNGIANMWNRREISVGSNDDQSHHDS
jgi:hypothetical protein